MEFKDGEELIIVHFGELWLKGRNRSRYIRALERNMREKLSGEKFNLERYYDRLVLRLRKDSDIKKISTKLRYVFGISNFEIVIATKPELKSISLTAKKMVSANKAAKKIKINSHRSYKQLKFNSVDVVNNL